MRRFLVAAAVSVAMPAGVLAASGEFAFVTGQVTLQKANGQRSTPVKGTPIDAGDTITTGADGMVQLTMVDQARLSLRPNTAFIVERYGDKPESTDGAVLNLIRGTLRTFTGLLSATTRDKYVMKTRIATVGIRGSGNILHMCEGADCDRSIPGAGGNQPVTVNHTIEGAHSVTNNASGKTVVTGPGQTAIVQGNDEPRFIPIPQFIAFLGNTVAGTPRPGQGLAGTAGTTAPPRVFAPSDVGALPLVVTEPRIALGANGLGFVIDTAIVEVGPDPNSLRDVVVASAGSPFLSQATPSGLQLQGTQLRGFLAYEGLQSGVNAVIGGGTLRDGASVALSTGETIVLGRTENATFGFFGTGSPAPGSVHWAYAPSSYPPYFSDVLTGTANYVLASATAPTNQNNTAGTLGNATLNVNFSNRTLSLGMTVTVPAASGNAGGQWVLSATGVPFAGNSFYASTGDRLVITRGSVSSATNGALAGSVEGGFVGRALNGAIVGYGISDTSPATSANWNFVSGVAAFTGPGQNPNVPYLEGRVSDPQGTLAGDFVQVYATTNRPAEVAIDAQGRATGFAAPFGSMGSHAAYSLGSAQVVQSGFDPETGLIWGRWGGGTAQVSGGGQSQALNLTNASLHYVFAGQQSGPPSLPLTGAAIYDVIGSTSPTDGAGHVGTLNSAGLNVNFTTRRLDATVNFGINGQTWNGSASNVPIYRDQYFSAFAGTPTPGLPNPGALTVTCTPNCGANANGSLDGFFTGRTGQRAGMMYNLGGNQGAVAFGRRGS